MSVCWMFIASSTAPESIRGMHVNRRISTPSKVAYIQRYDKKQLQIPAVTMFGIVSVECKDYMVC